MTDQAVLGTLAALIQLNPITAVYHSDNQAHRHIDKHNIIFLSMEKTRHTSYDTTENSRVYSRTDTVFRACRRLSPFGLGCTFFISPLENTLLIVISFRPYVTPLEKTLIY